jgi:hypothetical protein
VDNSIDNSVSSVRERVERFEDPIKVIKGLRGVLIGATHTPDLSARFERSYQPLA